MAICAKCNSPRVAKISAKCGDMCTLHFKDERLQEGYVPQTLGIGGGDYVRLSWCLECGQIQGTWPRPDPQVEE